MSGPKCYRYVVVEDPAVVAARLEAQRLAEASARAEISLLRLRSLAGQARELRAVYDTGVPDVTVPDVPGDVTSAEMTEFAARVSGQVAQVEAEIATAVDAGRKAAFMSSLGVRGGDSGPDGSSFDRLLEVARDRAAAAGSEDGGAERQAYAEAVVRVAGRLRADGRIEADEVQRIQQISEAALASAGSERAPLLLQRLRGAVESANRAASEQERRAAQVDELFVSLAGVPDPDDPLVVELRDALVRERDAGADIADLAARVASVKSQVEARIEAERHANDRQTVASALEQAFTELGYSVQEGFETVVGGGGPALVQRDGWSEHAVRVLLDDAGSFRMHVVKDAAPALAGEDDTECELQLCDDRARLEEALARSGVQMTPEELLPPGAVPVSRTAVADVRFERATKRSERAAREATSR